MLVCHVNKNLNTVNIFLDNQKYNQCVDIYTFLKNMLILKTIKKKFGHSIYNMKKKGSLLSIV